MLGLCDCSMLYDFHHLNVCFECQPPTTALPSNELFCLRLRVLERGTLGVVYIIFVLYSVLRFFIGTDRMNIYICYKKGFIKPDYTIGTKLLKNGYLNTRRAENPSICLVQERELLSSTNLEKPGEFLERHWSSNPCLNPKELGSDSPKDRQ